MGAGDGSPTRLWRRFGWKRIGGGLAILLLLVCLGRETGLYNFNVTREHADSQWNFKWENSFSSRPPRSVARWDECPEGVAITFTDGSKGLMTIGSLRYHGLYFLPVYKRIGASLTMSLQSEDGTISGEFEGSVEATIWGSCSVRYARQYARNTLINAIIQDLATRRL
jgi:hypothetical protein